MFVVKQAGFDPDATNSFQFSLDRSPSAPHFRGGFTVRHPLKLEQHDLFHRFVRERVEQLGAALGDFGEELRRRLVANDHIDPAVAKFAKPGLAANQSRASLLAIQVPPLGRDFAGRDHGEQAPKGVAIFRFNPAFGESTAKTVEGAVRRVMLVLPAPGPPVESTPSEFLQSQRNVLPQLFRSLLIPARQLINPGSH